MVTEQVAAITVSVIKRYLDHGPLHCPSVLFFGLLHFLRLRFIIHEVPHLSLLLLEVLTTLQQVVLQGGRARRGGSFGGPGSNRACSGEAGEAPRSPQAQQPKHCEKTRMTVSTWAWKGATARHRGASLVRVCVFVCFSLVSFLRNGHMRVLYDLLG